MVLPENGSIVVIDDKWKQAYPVIQAFSKKGIATTYYTGAENELPDKPLHIRLAIVDLQLLETDNDPHIIATRLVHILKKLIGPDNGPYILLIWSLKKSLYGEEVRREISKRENGIIPICIIELEKAKCIERKPEDDKLKEFKKNVLDELSKSTIEDSDLKLIESSIERNWIVDEDTEYVVKPDAIKTIEQSIESELKKVGVFHLFVIWENLLRNAGTDTVNSITTTIELTDLWENNMRDVIKRMGQARTGQNEVSDEIFLKGAMATFSSSFSEDLDYKIRNLNFPDYIKLQSPHAIAGKLSGYDFKIIVFSEGNRQKVKLLKNGEIYKGKDKIKIEKISSLATNLENNEKKLVEKLIKSYSEIPAIINTKLHLELEPFDEHMPGNVYKREVNEDDKKKFLSSYLNNIPEDISEYHFIELEVSPVCDYAQKKWKKSRLVSGLVYPALDTNLKHGPFYSNSPHVIIDDKKYSIVFNYLFFKSLDVNEVEQRDKPWFRIKRELLQDIVSGLSAHVNRPGITTMS